MAFLKAWAKAVSSHRAEQLQAEEENGDAWGEQSSDLELPLSGLNGKGAVRVGRYPPFRLRELFISEVLLVPIYS